MLCFSDSLSVAVFISLSCILRVGRETDYFFLFVVCYFEVDAYLAVMVVAVCGDLDNSDNNSNIKIELS